MEKLLIAGIDTVVGGNTAAWLAGRFQVLGLAASQRLAIAGCETGICGSSASSGSSPRDWIAAHRPAWVIHCGPASRGSWTIGASRIPSDAASQAKAWAAAAAEFNAPFTYISSDAVFTGPWMFHRETATSVCESPAARVLRSIEREVVEACPSALVIRTHAIGWAPCPSSGEFVDLVANTLPEGTTLPLDYMRHATPILATDLADLLCRAYERRVQGVLHLAGGERVNPFRLAYLLAEQFGWSNGSLSPIELSTEQRRQFGAGETSLQTRRSRKTLDMGCPLIREGLARLHEQHLTGYRDRFSTDVNAPERAA